MNGDAVKIQPPVYTNVPVETAMLATNLFGATTQIAASPAAAAAAHIPLITAAAAAAAAAGGAPPVAPPVAVAPVATASAAAAAAIVPAQQQQAHPHQAQILAHTHVAHQQQQQQQHQQQQQQTLQQHIHHQQQQQQQQSPHPAQHLTYGHQPAPPQATAGGSGTVAGGVPGTVAVGGEAQDTNEYAIMNGTLAQTQDGTVLCYTTDALNNTNLVALDPQPHQIVVPVQVPVQVPVPVQLPANGSADQQQGSHNAAGGEDPNIPLDKLKQMLATQLEYYFSRWVSVS